MKRLLVLAVCGLLSVGAMASDSVKEGVYIGSNGKKINLSSFEDEGIYYYTLAGLHGVSSDILYLESTETDKLKQNSKNIFTEPENAYTEEASNCQMQIEFIGNKLYLKSYDGCSKTDKLFIGQYVYSKKSSEIPSKYWGKWSKDNSCGDDSVFIDKTNFSPDGLRTYGIFSTEKVSDDTVILDGYTIDEGAVTNEQSKFIFGKDGIAVNISYQDENQYYTYGKCQ